MATVLDFLILHLVLTVVLRNMLLSPAGVWMVDFIFILIYSRDIYGAYGPDAGQDVVEIARD